MPPFGYPWIGLRQRLLAPLAQPGPGRLARHRRHVPPAPLAFHAAGALDRDARQRLFVRSTSVGAGRSSTSDTMKSIGRSRVAFEQRELRRRRRQDDLRLQRAADLLVLAQRLDLGEHSRAGRSASSIVPAAPRRRAARQSRRGRKQRHVHRLLARARQEAPQLVRRERQDRRHQPRQARRPSDTSPSAPSAARATARRTCTADPSRRRRRTRSGRRSRTRSAPGRSSP